MRSILLDGIIHWNPLLFCLNFVVTVFVSSWVVWSACITPSYSIHDPGFFCTTMCLRFFMLLLKFFCFSRSTITLYFHIFLWLPDRIISLDVTSCMTSYINRAFLQILPLFLIPFPRPILYPTLDMSLLWISAYLVFFLWGFFEVSLSVTIR